MSQGVVKYIALLHNENIYIESALQTGAKAPDPHTAERMHRQACEEMNAKPLASADYCSMCGEAWCSVRINKEIHKAIKTRCKT